MAVVEQVVNNTAAPPSPGDDRVPTVIADHLNVVYKVHRATSGRGSAPAALKRLVRRETSPAIREVHAIQDVSFTTYRGESVGLIGRNGSGKSTLMRAVAGLLPPTSGAVFSEGQPSLLGVASALMNNLTGERNIVLGCLAMGMTPAEVREQYDSIVEFSGLGDFIDLPMKTYSSGMQQRLRFAIAAAKSHDVLLIDEALATGDAEFRRRSEERIKELREEAGTVFLVSHGLDVITSTCTRAIWLEKGQILMDGDSESVVKAYSDANKRTNQGNGRANNGNRRANQANRRANQANRRQRRAARQAAKADHTQTAQPDQTAQADPAQTTQPDQTAQPDHAARSDQADQTARAGQDGTDTQTEKSRPESSN